MGRTACLSSLGGAKSGLRSRRGRSMRLLASGPLPLLSSPSGAPLPLFERETRSQRASQKRQARLPGELSHMSGRRRLPENPGRQETHPNRPLPKRGSDERPSATGRPDLLLYRILRQNHRGNRKEFSSSQSPLLWWIHFFLGQWENSLSSSMEPPLGRISPLPPGS